MTVDLTLGVRCVTLSAVPTRPTLGPVASEADQTQSLTLTPIPSMPSDRGGDGNRKSWAQSRRKVTVAPTVQKATAWASLVPETTQKPKDGRSRSQRAPSPRVCLVRLR